MPNEKKRGKGSVQEQSTQLTNSQQIANIH